MLFIHQELLVSQRELLVTYMFSNSTVARKINIKKIQKDFYYYHQFHSIALSLVIFWTLTGAGCLVAVRQECLSDNSEIINIIKNQEITHLLSVPSYYRALPTNISDSNKLKI